MKLKVPKLTPKKVLDTAKDPRTYWKVFNQLFPLGQGGLRTGYEPPKSDFLSDISVGYDYSGSYPGFQTPVFGEEIGEAEPYLEPTDRPKTTPAPYPWRDPTKEPKPIPWIPGPYPVPIPVPPFSIPSPWPSGTGGGWPETFIPTPPEPEYEDPEFKTEVYECDDDLRKMLNLPPCKGSPNEIQISTKKNSIQKNGQPRSSYSPSRFRNNSRQKSQRGQSHYSRYHLSRLRQPSRNISPRNNRNDVRVRRFRQFKYSRRTPIFENNWY